MTVIHMISRVGLAAFLVSLGACHGGKRAETDTNFDNYKPLAAAIVKADKVVLHEGLPHQFFDEKLLADELKTKETVQHHGFPFYAEPLPLKEDDGKELTKLFTGDGSFKPFVGYKKCGGFHPDYCIEWHVGTSVYRCLICFGCVEVKVYGPRTELYCDIARDAADKFKKLLQPYRKHRPKSEYE